MYKLTTLILMLCLSCQLVLKLSIIAWFEINQDYIAATLCENKSKPELVCCGKCVLTKQLNKADKNDNKEKNNAPTKTEKTSIVAFIIPVVEGQQTIFSPQFISMQNAVFPHHFAVAIPDAIFHPPSPVYS